MTRLHEVVRRVHQRATGADAERGTSMVEVVVAMIIMTICGGIFTGAMVTLYRANDAAQAATNSAQQTNQAYQTLDKMVRYAGAISTPGVGTSTGDWYVELSDTTGGSEVCTQLRLDKATSVLQQRTWNASSPSAVSGWRAVASNLTNASAASGSTDQPFVLLTPPANASRQRLAFTLVAQAGNPGGVRTSRSAFTLTALNSSVPQPTTPICQQVGRP